MDHMMNNLSQEWGDNSRKVFDELIKPDKQKMMNISILEFCIFSVVKEE